MNGLSLNNRTVQLLRRLLGRRSARHEEGLFVIEGPTLSAEAVAGGWTCLAQYVPFGSDVKVDGAGPVNELAIGVLERVATTEAPQPPLTLVEMKSPDVDEVLGDSSFVVVLDRINDPGNVGTILRSAEAAGVDAVVLTPGSVDAFNPKVVRSSAGSVFHVPVATVTIDDVATAGFDLIGTSSRDVAQRSVVDHTEANLSGRIALVMGNEADGLPDDWNDEVGPVRRWVTIRHEGRSESLNVAMATTVLVFEAARQRR
jgi:TrmH family RNA methyltransferase